MRDMNDGSMDESLATAVDGDSPLNFAMFNKLSPGIQRVVIAALFVVVLFIIVVLRELIKSGSMAAGEEESIEA